MTDFSGGPATDICSSLKARDELKSTSRRLLCGIADDRYDSLDLDVIAPGRQRRRVGCLCPVYAVGIDHAGRQHGQGALVFPLRRASAADLRIPRHTSAAASPAPGLTLVSSTMPSPNLNLTLSPAATSKLPRFLQSPAARDRSKS
ncbi:hypothetical protein MSAN_02484300 [Mycena sanguinolenta]|uniref:Uncharacterized protein n=1 Tax=Mycena sanguinolenta TaxID=230812 RepID=A0A8H6U504_9AGAR|nr:hypothetical protein MSAN_02484300 [Mycena sanguinolenta]